MRKSLQGFKIRNHNSPVHKSMPNMLKSTLISAANKRGSEQDKFRKNGNKPLEDKRR